MLRAVYLVALAELSGTIEDEATHLAADLGISLYEARLLLSGERPKIVLRTADETHARDLLAKLRARRHGAIACDSRAIVAIDEMVQVEQFQLTDTALVLADGAEFLYADVLALLRAVRTEHTTTKTKVTERKLAMGRAIASGGLLLSKKTTREESKAAEHREQVLFVFRKSGGGACVVRDSHTSFEGLATRMAPSVAENFVRLIAELRERAPDAVFDDRLIRFHAADAQSTSRLDEQVHLLALAIARLGRGPYR